MFSQHEICPIYYMEIAQQFPH